MEGAGQPRILVCDPIDDGALDLLRRHARVDVRTSLAPDELVDIVGGYDGLVVRGTTQITSEVIEAATALRGIARVGFAVDNIDIDAATERGIVVVHSPGARTYAVAEMTIGLILAVLRHIPAADRSVKAGRWERRAFRGRQLRGATVGVIGYGRIGREVARLAHAFGATVKAYTQTPRPLEHAKQVDFQALLASSDIITLHATLTSATRQLINREAIEQMRDGVVIVNTASGGLIDEAALLEALDRGKVAGAGLDVFADEPPSLRALVEHPRVVTTPRIGGSTQEADRAVSELALQSLLAVLRGEQPAVAVNPQGR
ncbi:hydroxyacid dehydrogenase [Sphaerobacter thermophilus]|uniref:D-isomer specific 2-hydroxyacid dehydrogenase NAD-binding protein n=1 Tax=Sphaerobacter thermophilus (strain ATCC 49802 / DSM 20745 / KCCM 41009 / NCIMB 13125 / S 6022) TaxID=479434 RepID=D1C3Y3_SPHTD|nr:hydroxyacid dehydrogenase [Sphaerobacter thermophilus]ACZ38950.1 D-isomer specific 2-hydroxyacid dehydrogenase NAD-binding protein [Sphaerobacter thermophilus DSM 20745]